MHSIQNVRATTEQDAFNKVTEAETEPLLERDATFDELDDTYVKLSDVHIYSTLAPQISKLADYTAVSVANMGA